MDIISFNEAATANGRIEKFNTNPDSNSGVLTQPKVIEAGETITIKSGRQAILANTVVEGDLVIEAGADVFVPAGAGFSDLDQRVDRLETLQIGAILNGYTIFDNCIVAFGGEFNRGDYPKLWTYLQANPSLVKTQAQWQSQATANGGICGFFSDGNGTTTFRVPNLDKAFLRPDSRGVGSYQKGSYLIGDASLSDLRSMSIANKDDISSEFIENAGFDKLVGTIDNKVVIANTGGVYYSGMSSVFIGMARPKNIAVLPLIVAK